jgi:hypothetical protein
MNLEKAPEIKSARVGLPVVDKLPKDGAPADKKNELRLRQGAGATGGARLSA